MKIFKTLFLLPLLLVAVMANGQNIDQAKYKGYAEQMTRMYFSMLNSLGDPENPIPEKEIIINESYIKLFKSDKVQIEDDLDANRKVPVFKDVQAYLRDVDFFYKTVKFSHEVTNTEILENDKGEPYVKVTVNRTLEGISVKDKEAVKNTQIRYLEINLDLAKEELKIASIYTTKINQKEELRNWWNTMPSNWQVLLTKNMNIGEEITDAQLKSIAATEKLVLTGDTAIKSLEPAGKLLKLKQIDISNTGVIDLMPLRNILSLEQVNLSGTKVSAITALRYAINLKELNLANTQLDSLTDVVNFTGLKALNISGTPITDLSPLADLVNLEDLELNQVQTTDLSSLASMAELKYLKIVGTPVENLSALGSLRKVEVVDISKSKVKDLQPLAYISTLKNIYMNNTEVTSIRPFSGKNLKHIYCDKTKIDKAAIRKFINENPNTLVVHNSDAMLNWWKGLPASIKEYIQKTALIPANPTIEHLHVITAIKELDLTSLTSLSDLSAVKMLSRLEKLNISGTQVSDITPLQNLADLQELTAANTPIANLTPLKELNKLKSVNLKKTKVADLSPLTGLLNLAWLNVEHTKVTKLDPIVALPAIKTVYADGNGITDTDAFVQNRKDVNIIYKSSALATWYKGLNPIWRSVFANYVKLDEQPTPEQLHKLINQEKIEIESNVQLSDLGPLTEMRNLKELRISDTQVSNLTPLSKLKTLEKLSITQSPVSNLAQIAGLSKLKYIDVSNTGVADLTPLANLRRLLVVKANGTQVKKLVPLAMLGSIEEVEIFNTAVANLKPLHGLKSLKLVKCYNTFATQKRVDKLKAALPNLNVIFYGGKKGFSNFWGLL